MLSLNFPQAPPEPEPGWDLEPNFEPDVLIFDWIGAALATGREKEMRHLYEAVATELKHIAIADNLSVFSFAQLNKVLSKNKARCDHTMLHECKSLPDQAVNALYISGLTNQEDNGEEAFSRGQMLNVAKSRFGPGGAFRFSQMHKSISRFLDERTGRSVPSRPSCGRGARHS